MQSNIARAIVALAAVALVVGAFFVLSDDGDDTTEETTQQAQTTSAPEPSGADVDQPEQKKEKAEAVPTIRLADAAPVDGVTELEFDLGDRIEFAVSSDIDAEVHVHGYEIVEQIPGGETVEFSFPADLDGIYEVESHTTGQQIAELRVNP